MEIYLSMLSEILILIIKDALIMFIDILTVIILFLTFLAVLAYTFIAKKQTDELIKQRRLSVMPSLLFTANQFMAIGEGETGVYLKNIGKGLAMNITIDDCTDPEIENCYFEFQPIDFIHPEEEVKAEFEFWEDSKKSIQKINKLWMFNKKANTLFLAEIVIRFMDIEGNKYKQTKK